VGGHEEDHGSVSDNEGRSGAGEDNVKRESQMKRKSGEF
jgi:hypothetical protein